MPAPSGSCREKGRKLPGRGQQLQDAAGKAQKAMKDHKSKIPTMSRMTGIFFFVTGNFAPLRRGGGVSDHSDLNRATESRSWMEQSKVEESGC